MTTSDVVVGAAFGDHAFDAGDGDGKVHTLGGDTCPWNTLALWHVPTLALLGFVGVAEGLNVESDRADGGVEEVTAIALIQFLAPSRSGAKLIKIPGLEWATSFDDEKRRRWHELKMRSKVERPASQMARLPGLPKGSVMHINLHGPFR